MVDLKKYVKEKYQSYASEQAERKKFRNELAKEELALRREAYRQESLKQAKIAGRRLAIQKANPQRKQKVYAFFNQAEQVRRGIATSSPQGRYASQRVERIKVKRKSTPRTIRVIYKTPVKRVRKKVQRRDPIAASLDWGF